MRTTFDSKIFGVKTYVLELVELDEADELLILFKLYNILGLLISLKSVNQHQLRVAEVVSNNWEISLLVLEHTTVSFNDFEVLVL